MSDTPRPSRLRAVEHFLSVEATSGIVLLLAALAALIWANSPGAHLYQSLWHTRLGVRLGGLSFEHDLRFWINEGLMAVFFFVVGLEIRREVQGGELGDRRRAALPVVAAAGGMLFPALIFLALNLGRPSLRGWGVPVATDIAFAVGVLALLGRRVHPALRVLLLTLAVVDDLGAILVIAAFYSSSLSISGFLVLGAGLALIGLLRKLGVRAPTAYLPAAVIVWAGALAAGVHPTLAGVVVAFASPARHWYGDRLEHGLHGWVAFALMPLFALANAGVPLHTASFGGPGAAAFLGVVLGLAVGKPLGVLALSWAATRLGLAALPPDLRWSDLLVMGLVAGIGFTMSLFIAGLAFPEGPLLETVKLAVLSGSALSAVVGLTVGGILLARRAPVAG
ncbi:MAG TPA: Na+/H+ antiporter NhaA [Polyangia bacterium]|nr:Na+/H+ antiporter NhaA [Polyangia bacterium]